MLGLGGYRGVDESVVGGEQRFVFLFGIVQLVVEGALDNGFTFRVVGLAGTRKKGDRG